MSFNYKQTGIVRVTYEVLRDSFSLPADHKIVRVRDNFENNTIEFQVEGPTMPLIAEGNTIPYVELNNIQENPPNEFEF